MITVYTGPNCQQCIATKRALDRRGIAYTLIDASDPAVAEQLRARGFRELPVVEVDWQEPWSGFRPDLIAKLEAK